MAFCGSAGQQGSEEWLGAELKRNGRTGNLLYTAPCNTNSGILFVSAGWHGRDEGHGAKHRGYGCADGHLPQPCVQGLLETAVPERE